MIGDSSHNLGKKYTLLDRIGMGGMAEVFKGKLSGAEGFEKVVVIKKLLPQFAQDAEIVAHFIAEAKLAALLQHENIAQIYDFGELDGSYFIAMEYLVGKDLYTVMRRAKELNLPMGITQSLFITCKICEAMEYAHALKDQHLQPLHLIHRDLSPHNVFITCEGRVKIIDFGIARADLFDNKTKIGMAKGKISYMSPEQLTAEKVDHRSDIFAIGILLYEMLSGKRMYSGDTATLIRKCMGAEYERLDELQPDLPTPLSTILDKALAKDVAGRYQGCGEMRSDIEDFLFSMEKRASSHLLEDSMRLLFADEQAIDMQSPAAGDIIGAANHHGNWREPAETTALHKCRPQPHPSPPGMSGGNGFSERAEQVAPPTPDVSLSGKAGERLAQEPPKSRPAFAKLLAVAGVCSLFAVVFFLWPEPKIDREQSVPAPLQIPAESADTFKEAIPAEPLQPVLTPPEQSEEPQKNTAEGLFTTPKDNRSVPLQRVVGGQRQKKIHSLVGKAEQAMERSNLTTPREASAYKFYHEILELEPQNALALQGLAKISEKYEELAEKAFREMRLPSAREYIRQGLAVNPQNRHLLELQQDMAKSKPEMFFKSIEKSFKTKTPARADGENSPKKEESTK